MAPAAPNASAAAVKPTSASAAAAPGPEDIAANWVERKDKKTGRSFWGNKVTKGTTWTRPACLAAPVDTTAAAPAAPKMPARKAAAPKPAVTTPAAVPAAAAAAAPGPEDIAANWVERKDKKTGRSFWGNKVTKGTTWTRPACLTVSVDTAAAASSPEDRSKSSAARVAKLVNASAGLSEPTCQACGGSFNGDRGVVTGVPGVGGQFHTECKSGRPDDARLRAVKRVAPVRVAVAVLEQHARMPLKVAWPTGIDAWDGDAYFELCIDRIGGASVFGRGGAPTASPAVFPRWGRGSDAQSAHLDAVGSANLEELAAIFAESAEERRLAPIEVPLLPWGSAELPDSRRSCDAVFELDGDAIADGFVCSHVRVNPKLAWKPRDAPFEVAKGFPHPNPVTVDDTAREASGAGRTISVTLERRAHGVFIELEALFRCVLVPIRAPPAAGAVEGTLGEIGAEPVRQLALVGGRLRFEDDEAGAAITCKRERAEAANAAAAEAKALAEAAAVAAAEEAAAAEAAEAAADAAAAEAAVAATRAEEEKKVATQKAAKQEAAQAKAAAALKAKEEEDARAAEAAAEAARAAAAAEAGLRAKVDAAAAAGANAAHEEAAEKQAAAAAAAALAAEEEAAKANAKAKEEQALRAAAEAAAAVVAAQSAAEADVEATVEAATARVAAEKVEASAKLAAAAAAAGGAESSEEGSQPAPDMSESDDGLPPPPGGGVTTCRATMAMASRLPMR